MENTKWKWYYGGDNAPIKSKLQHRPRVNRGHLTIFCARGMGNLTFTWVGWGKLNQKCQASSDFLFRALKSLVAMITCLDEIKEFKGRDWIFLSDWLTKKGLQKLWSALDEKMDLHQICPAQIWCKIVFALEQTCSKRRKGHICYHICTPV